MEEIRFKSLNELYIRLLPAFNTKQKELLNKGINVREIDIWNYLKENIWIEKPNIDMYQIVNDIFSLDETKLMNFINKTK